MRTAIKLETRIQACQLGKGSALEKQLLAQGRLIRTASDRYEVFSQEVIRGHGELAHTGDYVKIDSKGFPYPNDKAFFEQNHRQIGENTYLQRANPVSVWFFGDPEEDIIAFLRQHKGLQIDPDSIDACFTAPLWGTVLTAKRDAALVIYSTLLSARGQITDAVFNFVAADEFAKTYQLT